MKKSEALNKMMIPITVRKPPDDHTHVIVWNPKVRRWGITSGIVLNAQMSQIESGNWKGKDDPALFHSGYYASHWAILYPMEDEA